MSKPILVAGALAVVGMVLGSHAQAAVADDSWLPFQGCWRASDAPAGTLLCIVADGERAQLIELADGAVTRETYLIPDGQARPLPLGDCTGTERARWSADRLRLYIDTQVSCDEQFELTGVFSMISTTEWVSIQAIAVDNDAEARVVVYEIVEPVTGAPESVMTALRESRRASETARHAVGPMTIDDVREAAREVHPRAVEALLLARNQPFALTGKQLLAWSDDGVPGYLIDAVVAVSHPELFEVEAVPVTAPQPQEAASGGYVAHSWSDGYDPWCGNDYLRYAPYSFGCDDGCYNSYDWDYRNAPVIVIRDTDSGNRASAGPRGYSSGLGGGSGSSDVGGAGGERLSGDASVGNRSSGESATSSAGSSGSTGSSGETPTSSGSSSTTTGKAKPRDSR